MYNSVSHKLNLWLLFFVILSGEPGDHFHGDLYVRMFPKDSGVWVDTTRRSLFTKLLEHTGLRNSLHGVSV